MYRDPITADLASMYEYDWTRGASPNLENGADRLIGGVQGYEEAPSPSPKLNFTLQNVL